MGEKIQKYPVIRGIVLGILSLTTATVLGYTVRRAGFLETNIVLLYLLGVVTTASLSQGFLYGILTSVAATLSYNYFFTSPYHSLDVDNPDYLVTFFVMTAVSLVTSTLTSRMRKNMLDARERERETKELYHLTEQLTRTNDQGKAASVVAKSVGGFLRCQAACLCFDEEGKPQDTYVQQTDGEKQTIRIQKESEKYFKWLGSLEEICGQGDEFFEYPIRGEEGLLGVIRIPKESDSGFEESQRRFLCSAVECTALAMSRIISLKRQIKSQQETTQERYRSNLLRAISHDLRTPLSGIMGTSEMIMNMSGEDDPRYHMAGDISKDARWLHSLVENILSLTRLQNGPMALEKEWEVAEEIVGGALEQMQRRAPEYDIAVDMPGEPLLVPMDARLIMQVLINLLDNAVKHTPPEGEIKVTVSKDQGKRQVLFAVSDRGEGISPEDLPKIFETFYTSRMKSADARKGIGLGLAICKSIVQAHGGTIAAENRKDGPGAVFCFTLPLEDGIERGDGNDPVS